ncbi:MAG TPA: trypsin-like peptidase domain-containing protein [Anaeromyxobacter sp.]|nr:trypsin-like peptidase domain-containing protein [Anaeromyxobacter sp.]
MQPDLLQQLSAQLATLSADAAQHVVRVDGRRHASSSGVVWSADGVVVTAHHTLERDEDVSVALPSGDSAPAEVLGRDPTTDVALLRVATPGLSPATWADEAGVAVGQLVVGVSRPGRTARVALGVVARAAGEFRAHRGGKVDRYVETSLLLHPGVSGSLVAGADGVAIGVATAGLVRGAAMVLPPTTLRRVVKSILAHGEVRRGYLGLATLPVPLPAPVREATGEHVGLLVTRIDPDSPAARAGIQLGDALLSFGDETLQDPGELLTLLAEDRIGDTVKMKLLRAGEARDVQVTIGSRGAGRRT